jgi:hypothetical protein
VNTCRDAVSDGANLDLVRSAALRAHKLVRCLLRVRRACACDGDA